MSVIRSFLFPSSKTTIIRLYFRSKINQVSRDSVENRYCVINRYRVYCRSVELPNGVVKGFLWRLSVKLFGWVGTRGKLTKYTFILISFLRFFEKNSWVARYRNTSTCFRPCGFSHYVGSAFSSRDRLLCAVIREKSLTTARSDVCDWQKGVRTLRSLYNNLRTIGCSCGTEIGSKFAKVQGYRLCVVSSVGIHLDEYLFIFK